MTTAYPTNLDSFANPIATNPLNNPSHSAQHANANDAIEAIQAFVGVEGSTVDGTVVKRVADLESGTVDLVSDQDVGGIKSFTEEAHFKTAAYFDSINGVEFGLIDMIDDPNSDTGKVMIVESDAGVRIGGPYITLDSPTLRIGVPGALAGSLVSVAAVDAFGKAQLGYSQPLPESFSITDTQDVDVTIKAQNAAPAPTVWVDLGLQVTLPANIAAGTGNVAYEMVLVNATTRTGVLEFGLEVDGVVLTRDVLIQIAANFNQTVSANIPLVNAYTAGQVFKLVARVTSNSNDQFGLVMDCTPDLAGFTVWAIGSSGGGGGSGDSYTKAEADARFLGISANAVSATTASQVNDNGAAAVLDFWFGTEAEFAAIATKDPKRIYLRSA